MRWITQIPRTARRNAWAAALLCCSTAACAQPDAGAVYVIDPQHTRVHWEVMHFGTYTSRGWFDDIEGQIRWSAATGQGAVSISVGTASVNTGVGPLNAMLRGDLFLQSAAHTRAEFVARDFRTTFRPTSGAPHALHSAVGEHTQHSAMGEVTLHSVVGELTLRGQSLPLTLVATRFQCAPHPVHQRELCGGDFEALLQRSDFGITYGLPLVANRVRLVIQIEALRQ